MTPNQAKWAQSHDWYHGTTGKAWITVLVKVRNSHGRLIIRQFVSFRELYKWAGY